MAISAAHQPGIRTLLILVLSVIPQSPGRTAGVEAVYGATTRSVAPQDPEPGIEVLQRFLQLARDHRPGELDGPLETVRSLSLAALASIGRDFHVFTQFLHEPNRERPKSTRREYTEVELRLLSAMANAELTGGSANTLLKRVALLHADAMALPGSTVLYAVLDDSTRGAADITMISDGVSLGAAITPPNWRMGREAVGALLPSPAGDDWVRRWYEATTAYLFYSMQYGSIPAHLDARRAHAPGDPGTTFAEACLYEALAGERVQQVIARNRDSSDAPDARSAYARARQLFEEVLASNPGHVEARLRRAHVLWRMGEARLAAEELDTVAAAAAQDRELRYLAALFLGSARHALGDDAGATSAFEAALRLYPAAQAPAISLLLVRPGRGDERDPAVEAVLGKAPLDRDDPWLNYHLGPGRRANALMAWLWRNTPIS